MTGQPNTLTADRVRGNATRLLLTNLAGEAETLAGRAEAAQLGYLEFVDLLLEEEVGVREGRRFRNALKLSGLPHHKTLDDFDFAFQPDLDARKVRDLAALGFVRAHANVALLGPPGVGKSHLAVALAVAGCQAGFSIYFTSLDDMVRHLAVAERTGNLPKTSDIPQAELACHRRNRTSSTRPEPSQPRLPTGVPTLRTGVRHHHLKQGL
jgi:DNA replication protein DnaC